MGAIPHTSRPGEVAAAARTSAQRDEPEQAPPWRPEDGPQPDMSVWPYSGRPALSVRIGARWIYAPVTARADYEDGRIAYHVTIVLPEPLSGGQLGAFHRAYWWPQAGRLKVAHGPQVPPIPGRGNTAA
ncbi:hypothetical protein [Streptomyces sp. NPDC056244]|uniref:hypothetical protein n=1 Tax=Streptomyces sp. NPDC056244 TaxID=3345762 RepID=UPI0035DAC658